MTKVEFAKQVSIIKIYNDFSGYRVTEEEARYHVLCPFHCDSRPSMKLYTDKNMYVCFACGKKGSTIDFVIEKLSMTDEPCGFMDAVNLICSKYGYSGEDNPSSIKDVAKYNRKITYSHNLALVAKALSGYRNAIKGASNYFTKRGISETIQEEYQLGFFHKWIKFDKTRDLSTYIACGLCDKEGETSSYKERWIIPLRDYYGNVIGFAGRDPKATEAKYINSKETEFFKKGETLFNYDKAKGYNTIYVVEGFMDCLSLIQAGVKNVVALMGCELTAKHLEMLKGKQIILALDNDMAGVQATKKIIATHPEIKFEVVMPFIGKDFNELLLSDGEEMLKHYATDLADGIDFLLDGYEVHPERKSVATQEKMWTFLASMIGAREKEYRDKYPLNTIYTPIAINRYWERFDNINKEE